MPSGGGQRRAREAVGVGKLDPNLGQIDLQRDLSLDCNRTVAPGGRVSARHDAEPGNRDDRGFRWRHATVQTTWRLLAPSIRAASATLCGVSLRKVRIGMVVTTSAVAQVAGPERRTLIPTPSRVPKRMLRMTMIVCDDPDRGRDGR